MPRLVHVAIGAGAAVACIWWLSARRLDLRPRVSDLARYALPSPMRRLSRQNRDKVLIIGIITGAGLAMLAIALLGI
jgi:hypothetical protein